MNISERLKIIISLSGLTQQKLAEKLGVSFPTLNSWINAKSQPRKTGEGKINKLYFQITGEKELTRDPLFVKRQIIISKRKGNILKEIMNNPDIYEQFLLSTTYNTNRIEGSTLTENDTKAILFDNVALSGKTIIEQLEVKNHQACWAYLLKYLAGKSSKIDEKLILKLHSILMNGIIDDAGYYREHAVRIVGNYVPTANYQKIPQLMKQTVKDINMNKKDVIKHVSNIHSRFEQIHPFSDGNGRIGRLILQAMLLKYNLPPAIIKQKKKGLYNNCLRTSQLKDDFLPLEDFICDAVFEGFKILKRI